MDLVGGKEYTWGSGYKHSPTEKQENIIRIIKRELGIEFHGSTSEDAYEFIGKYEHKITLK